MITNYLGGAGWTPVTPTTVARTTSTAASPTRVRLPTGSGTWYAVPGDPSGLDAGGSPTPRASARSSRLQHHVGHGAAGLHRRSTARPCRCRWVVRGHLGAARCVRSRRDGRRHACRGLPARLLRVHRHRLRRRPPASCMLSATTWTRLAAASPAATAAGWRRTHLRTTGRRLHGHARPTRRAESAVVQDATWQWAHRLDAGDRGGATTVEWRGTGQLVHRALRTLVSPRATAAPPSRPWCRTGTALTAAYLGVAWVVANDWFTGLVAIEGIPDRSSRPPTVRAPARLQPPLQLASALSDVPRRRPWTWPRAPTLPFRDEGSDMSNIPTGSSTILGACRDRGRCNGDNGQDISANSSGTAAPAALRTSSKVDQLAQPLLHWQLAAPCVKRLLWRTWARIQQGRDWSISNLPIYGTAMGLGRRRLQQRVPHAATFSPTGRQPVGHVVVVVEQRARTDLVRIGHRAAGQVGQYHTSRLNVRLTLTAPRQRCPVYCHGTAVRLGYDVSEQQVPPVGDEFDRRTDTAMSAGTLIYDDLLLADGVRQHHPTAPEAHGRINYLRHLSAGAVPRQGYPTTGREKRRIAGHARQPRPTRPPHSTRDTTCASTPTTHGGVTVATTITYLRIEFTCSTNMTSTRTA